MAARTEVMKDYLFLEIDIIYNYITLYICYLYSRIFILDLDFQHYPHSSLEYI